jgi:hypothetical protein
MLYGYESQTTLWIGLVGYFLILCDVGSWALWIGITAKFVERGDNLALAGFTALVAPHTVIIPTVFAILHDIGKNCVKMCRLETPPWQWFVFPLLVIPLDALTLAYNRKTVENKEVIFASWWALADAIAVAVWAAASYLLLYRGRLVVPEVVAQPTWPENKEIQLLAEPTYKARRSTRV